jgi:competence protein ComEC
LAAAYPDCVSLTQKGRRWTPRRIVADARNYCRNALWKRLQHRQAGLASAILLGAREQLDRERIEGFFVTGTIHLLAISGLHVGILAYGFWWLTRLFSLRRQTAVLIVSGLVVAYAVLTDARPPVLRATILVLALCSARLLGRRVWGYNALAAAGLVILSLNPASLFQAGTQLSFIAVMTICHFGRNGLATSTQSPLDRLIARSRPRVVRAWYGTMGMLGQLCWIGAVIWIVALPLTTYRFHLFSPIAIVLNPLVWIPMAAALFSGFGVMLFAWPIPPLADACGTVCNASLGLLESIVSTVRDVPGAYQWTPGPGLWWVVTAYAAMALWLAFPECRPARRWALTLAVAWLACGIGTMYRTLPFSDSNGETQLQCTFLSVGHGVGTVVELPGGQVLLYDAGRLGSPMPAVHGISAFLWSRGITHLDAVVLSHADVDHYNALPELLERFSIGIVYVSPVMFKDETPPLQLLREAIRDAGTPLQDIDASNSLAIGDGAQIHVLHPPRDGICGGDNANSIVLLVDCGGQRVLLPGDLESPGLEAVLAEEPIRCRIAMAPHHGSMRSHPERFAAWCTPQWVVISGGYNDIRSPVNNAFTDAGAQVRHTATDGAVRAVINESGARVQGWRRDGW